MPTVSELETLLTRYVADVEDLKRGMRQAEDALKRVGRVSDQSAAQVDSALMRMGRQAVTTGLVLAGVGGAVETALSSVKLAAEAEKISASFEVLVGDAEKAQKTLADLRQFADETPFELPELLEASKSMLAFGTRAEEIVPTMRMLGEVSSALGKPLGDLAYVFGTLKTQGRAFTVDIRQFAMRGIPIYLELAKVLGIVGSAAKELSPEDFAKVDKVIEKGGVNFEMVEQAFKKMTSAGGQFFGQLDKQSKTLLGLFSTLKDEVKSSMTEIGKFLIEGLDLKTLIAQVREVSKEFKEWLQNLSPQVRSAIKTVLVLTTAVIALTAAIFVAGVVFNTLFGGIGLIVGGIVLVIGLTAWWVETMGGLDKAWKIVKKSAQDFWNFLKPILPEIKAAFVMTGPVGMLVAAISYLVDNWEEVSQAVADFYKEARPILKAVWSLVNSIALGVRDQLVGTVKWWKDALVDVGRIVNILAEDFKRWYNGLSDGAKRVVQALGAIAAPILVVLKLLDMPWDEFRDKARDAVLAVEYSLKNMELHWKRFANQVDFYLTYIYLELGHLFLVNVPLLAKYFYDTFRLMFEKSLVIGVKFVDTLVNLIKSGVENLADIISGKINFADIVKDKMKEFGEAAAKEWGKIPDLKLEGRNEYSQKERDALKRAAEADKQLKEGFDKFRKDKLLQFYMDDLNAAIAETDEEWGKFINELIDQTSGGAKEAGAESGRAFSDEMSKNLRIDFTAFDSQEARQRVSEYLATLPGLKSTKLDMKSPYVDLFAPMPNVVANQQVDLQPRQIVVAQPAPANANDLAQTELLRGILQAAQAIFGKPPVKVGPAGLNQ